MAEKAKYLDPDVEKNLWSEVEEFKNQSLTKRKKHELRWRLARSFIKGDQWLRIDATQTKLEPAPVGKKPKIVINRLLPARQTVIAHLLKNRPVGNVLPETTSEEDRNAARVADEVAEYDLRAQEWDAKLSEEAVPEMADTGNAFFKWYWNPLAGKEVPVPVLGDDGNVVVGEDGLPAAEMKPQGEPALEVVSPEELILDPGARKFRDCQMVIHDTFKPVDEMRRLLPDQKDEIKPVDLTTDQGTSAFARGIDAGLTEGEMRDRCEVMEVWAKPHSEKWPQGLHAIFVNETLLLAEPTPKGHDAIPFAHLGYIPIPGEVYATSPVIQAIDAQKALNLSVSRDQYRRNVQRPRFVVSNDSGIDEEEISNDDSEVLSKNQGSDAGWQSPPVYTDDKEARNYYEAAINDLFQNVAVLMGEAQGEERSGRQVWMRTENAGTALSGASRAIERALQKVVNGLLRLRRAYTDEQRTIQIVGVDRSIEVKAFTSADLEGSGDYYVVPGSALPTSKSQRQQMVLDLMDRTVDPRQKEKLKKLLPWPADMESALDEDRLDRDRATEENEMFARLTEEVIADARMQAEGALLQRPPLPQMPVLPGMPPPGPSAADVLRETLRVLKLHPRSDFENWQVHLETHNRFRKTSRYRALPQMVQDLVDEHCDWTVPPPPPMPEQPGPGGGVRKEGPMQMGGPLTPTGGAGAPEPAGDRAAGMPKMPQTPSPGHPARM